MRTHRRAGACSRRIRTAQSKPSPVGKPETRRATMVAPTDKIRLIPLFQSPLKEENRTKMTVADGCRSREKGAQGVSLYVERLFRG